MNDESNRRAEERLDQDLRALRVALRAIEAPADEAGLVAALQARNRRAQFVPPFAPAQTRRSSQRRYAALATAATGVLAAVTTFAWMYSGREPTSGGPGAAPMAAAPPAVAQRAGTFRPLSFGPAFSPGESYSIVRVRIPLSSLAHGVPLDGSIEAELLVGEDGLASGIRFNPTDTLVVSAVSP